MLVWSGRGVIPLLFFNLIFWGLILLTSMGETDEAPAIIACFATAIFCWYMGPKWDYQTYESALLKQAGHQVEIIPTSTLFWIRVKYWGHLFTLIGILLWAGVFG